MSNIIIKPVEYPKGKILDLSQLSDLGLIELYKQADAFKWEVEDEINKRLGDD